MSCKRKLNEFLQSNFNRIQIKNLISFIVYLLSSFSHSVFLEIKLSIELQTFKTFLNGQKDAFKVLILYLILNSIESIDIINDYLIDNIYLMP